MEICLPLRFVDAPVEFVLAEPWSGDGWAVVGALPRARIMVEFMTDFTSVEVVLEHLILTLFPWAAIVVLSYNLVRRVREIHLGVD